MKALAMMIVAGAVLAGCDAGPATPVGGDVWKSLAWGEQYVFEQGTLVGVSYTQEFLESLRDEIIWQGNADVRFRAPMDAISALYDFHPSARIVDAGESAMVAAVTLNSSAGLFWPVGPYLARVTATVLSGRMTESGNQVAYEATVLTPTSKVFLGKNHHNLLLFQLFILISG